MARKKKPDAEPSTPPTEAVTPAAAPAAPEAPSPTAGSRPTEPAQHEAAEGPPSGGHAAAHRPDGPVVPNPFGYRRDHVAGVRLLEDRRLRQSQLAFKEKPSDAVREVVRGAGFRWHQNEQVWAKRIDPEAGWRTRADAEALFEQVVAMIKAEKGIAHEIT